MHYKLAICDDSSPDQNYIKNLAQDWAEHRRHTVQTDTFSSAESFLFHYAAHKDYDILLLDIEMGEMDGVSLAKRLRQENKTIQIIFITGFPEYIAEGYEVSALHYLLKPVGADKLAEVLDKAAASLKKMGEHLIFTINGETLRIAADEILYVEAFAHVCQINTLSGVFEIRQSISELAGRLGGGFVRAHRSYLVRIACMKRISRSEITLDNGEKIPLSRGSYQTVNQAFIRYFRGDCQ